MNQYGTANSWDKNRLVLSRRKILDDSDRWLLSLNSYDACGRLAGYIGSNHLSTNSLEGGTYTYDWADNVLTSSRTHGGPDGTYKVFNSMTYDHAGRLDLTKHRIDDGPEYTLSDKTYDKKNQITECKIGKVGNLPYLQTMNYSYLENGMLDEVNQSTLGGDLFYEKLHYYTTATGVSAQIQKNGNITAVASQVSGKNRQTFGYQYDHLNRMKEADYYGGSIASVDDYNVSLTYDKLGNINTLKRYGRAGGNAQQLIDDLVYQYPDINNKNKLTKVLDQAPVENRAYGYNNTSTNDYTYDGNGNITHDPSRGVTFSYNYFDLPVRADFGDGNVIKWLYDAEGSMLRKTVLTNEGTSNETVIDKRDYVGGIEYHNDIIDFIYHAEGRVQNTAGALSGQGQINITGSTSETKLYEAGTITSSQVLEPEANIEYKAGIDIVLNPGFLAKPGSMFLAHIVENDGGVDWQYQFTISDHLGNTRVVYADKDNNGRDNENITNTGLIV